MVRERRREITCLIAGTGSQGQADTSDENEFADVVRHHAEEPPLTDEPGGSFILKRLPHFQPVHAPNGKPLPFSSKDFINITTSNTTQHVLYSRIISFLFAKPVIQKQNSANPRNSLEKIRRRFRERNRSVFGTAEPISTVNSGINKISASLPMKGEPEIPVFRHEIQWRPAAQNAYIRHCISQ